MVRLRMIALFRSRKIPYASIRDAESFARDFTGHPQPFVTEPMWTHSSDVYLRVSQQYIAATRAGQLALPLLEEFLEPAHHGMEFGPGDSAVLWQPESRVVIDPRIQFGEPCIKGTRIPTESIASLNDAGESSDRLTKLYGLNRTDVEAAIAWERRLERAA